MNRFPKYLLCLAAVVGCFVPFAASWSTTTTTTIPISASRRRIWLPIHEATTTTNTGRPPLFVSHRKDLSFHSRGNSVARSLKASRAVDMEDAKAMHEMESSVDSLENNSELQHLDEGTLDPFSLEAALDTAQIDADMRELTQKVLNAVFLAVCFGWAAYTILNIDSGMTRGWTQGEIAMRIPLDNWSNYESSLVEKPVFTKTLINVIIYLLGDWLSQTVFQKRHVLDFDVSRTLKNGFIGLCFGPLVHQYYAFSDHILPVEGGLTNRISKIFMDQSIYLTVKCSIYICMVGLLSGDDWPTCKQNVKDKIGGIVVTAWKFWPLVHCITYGVIPARHRILWVNSVDLVWNAILASKTQKEKPGDDDVVKAEDIKESAEVLLANSDSAEPMMSSASDRQTDDNGDSTVQDVPLVGSSIEIYPDGERFLVAGDDSETRIPIASAAKNNTAVQDSRLSP